MKPEDIRVTIRLTPAELKDLEDFCEAFEITKSDAIRKAIGVYIRAKLKQKKNETKKPKEKSIIQGEDKYKEVRDKREAKARRKKGFKEVK